MPVIPFRSQKTPAPFTVQPPPAPSRCAVFVQWLRKAHGWIGLWGAALGLVFGVTGILLNHRAILKIPAAQSQESTVQIELPNPVHGLIGFFFGHRRVGSVTNPILAMPAFCAAAITSASF